jgi:mannose-6-phosphate isomerase-like protein (cupin superfamily)
MRRILPAMFAAACLTGSAFAQDTAYPPGRYKSASEIGAELEQSTSPLGIVAGQVTEVVATDSGRVVVRRRQAGPNNASIHDDVTETYYIVSGAGTFVTGGTIANPDDRTLGITGGVSQRVEAGDFVVLPPGTAHWFAEIEGSITYVETRLAVTQ